MKDTGRMRICEEIAKLTPYSVDEVYEVYEYVREKKTKTAIVITLDEQLSAVKTILHFATTFQVPPLKVAQAAQYDEAAMADEKPFDVALDRVGLRLATIERLCRHMGNVLDEKLKAEIQVMT